MSKRIKDLMTDEILKDCQTVDSACVVDISGLNAIKTNKLRGALKKHNIQLQVVKNSLARRAFADGPLGPLAKSLTGPCALVFGEPAITDIAKELVKWAREYKEITLKNGTIEGDADLMSVDMMAQLKGRMELLGEIAMLLSSPARRLAGAIQSPAGKIAGCAKAKADQEEIAAAVPA
ncbi:MAG: 50S ribosomal protein L10 [Phycisphaerae bacterium]|nr:50S ribosomal protein L10 [Phycisphaerae bacterium]